MFNNYKENPEQVIPLTAIWLSIRQYYVSSINQRFKDQDQKNDNL